MVTMNYSDNCSSLEKHSNNAHRQDWLQSVKIMTKQSTKQRSLHSASHTEMSIRLHNGEHLLHAENI
jgi:quinol monooxygenase YgiN